jgi:hypothetical protein
MGDVQIGQEYAFEGETGIRLARGAQNMSDVVTSHLHRVLINPYADLSIIGMVRSQGAGVVLAQLSWYSAISGPSFAKTIQPIIVQSPETWQPFRLDMQAPKDAIAVSLFLRLRPPSSGTATVDFDNIRIIEWAHQYTEYNPLYNYALLTGVGELTFTQQIFPGAEQWLITPVSNQIK